MYIAYNLYLKNNNKMVNFKKNNGFSTNTIQYTIYNTVVDDGKLRSCLKLCFITVYKHTIKHITM